MAAWKQFPEDLRCIEQFPKGRPLFITGSPRSGTTWVAAMLAVPGVWYIHEPFNPNKNMWHEEFTFIPAGAMRDDVDRIVKRILRGGARCALHLPNVSLPLMPLRWMPVKYRQLLLKDPIAALMAEFLTLRLNARTLALFRHPAGFVRSYLDLGWPSARFLRQFLNTPQLIKAHFSEQAGLIGKYAEDDSLESATVLHSCICRVLWRTAERLSNVILLRFEDLADEPLARFEELFGKLDLPYNDKIREMHTGLTQGTRTSEQNNPHAVFRNSSRMAWKWRGTFSRPELDCISRLWKEFDVPLYGDLSEWGQK